MTYPTPSIRAIDWPATRSFMRRRGFWPWLTTVLLIIDIPACLIAINITDPGHPAAARTAAKVVIAISPLIFCAGFVGAAMAWMNRRVRKSLRRYPWISFRIRYISDGGNEWVELQDPHGNPISQLILSTWARDIGKIANKTMPEIWFAGDPRKYGAISPPGGSQPRHAYYSPARKGDPANSTPEPDSVRYGMKDDPRYPSPRKLRRVIAFAIDWIVNLSPAAAIIAIGKISNWTSPFVLYAIGAWFAVSFAHRVVIQALVHTTLGKALLGLCVISPIDGRYPSFHWLIKTWLRDLALIAVILGNAAEPDRIKEYFLPAIRWRDRHLHMAPQV